jgi:hypothetical protein
MIIHSFKRSKFVFSILGLLYSTSCNRNASPAPRSTTPDVTRIASPTTLSTASIRSTDAAQASTLPPDTQQRVAINLPDTAELEARLVAHFSKYVDGSAFDFINQDFAAQISRYGTKKALDASTLSAQLRRYYAEKAHLKLIVVPQSLKVRVDGNSLVTTFRLKQSWSQKPPHDARKCGSIDESTMQWQPNSVIVHSAEVEIELRLDASNRFVSYEEHEMNPRLKVVSRGQTLVAFETLPSSPARLIELPQPHVEVKDGTVVEDLGESFTCALDLNESDTIRKIRWDGRSVWILSDWLYNTGHNFVGDTLLKPVE